MGSQQAKESENVLTDSPAAHKNHLAMERSKKILHVKFTNLQTNFECRPEHIKGYIHDLLNKTFKFEISSIERRTVTGTLEIFVQLHFESGKSAKQAVHMLNKNRHETNVSARLDEEDFLLEKPQEEFLKLKEQLTSKASEFVVCHEGKIQQERSAMEKLSMGRRVALDDYLAKEQLRKAHQQKLTELEAQLLEFNVVMAVIFERLDEALQGRKWKKTVNELRKEFGRECERLRLALPIYAKRREIVETVVNNQVSVVLGETGSGKSTQLVQYLLQSGLGPVACTQPRKVAAVTLAQRVAQESGGNVGQTIGYKTGMTARTSHVTEVTFLTDHSLLNECLQDPLLEKYKCVVVDEAHERSIYTDLLIGMLKKCLEKRPHFKVIITSATIDPDVFVAYFNNHCPVIRVPGRVFPVQITWGSAEESDDADYVTWAVSKALEVVQELKVNRVETAGWEAQGAEAQGAEVPGTESQGVDARGGTGSGVYEPRPAVLVFLATPLETERASDLLKSQCAEACCLQLHGRVQGEEQQKVFAEAPQHTYKVVFATNAAETSITIPGIRYVIDTGVIKEAQYDPRRNSTALKITSISRSSADQRKGRAGRTAPGVCYRKFTQEVYDDMRAITPPEILRMHLGQTLLKLMLLGIQDPLSFDFVQSPPVEALQEAMTSLEELAAVENKGITPQGRQMAKLSLEPRHAKMVLLAIEAKVGLEALVVAASNNLQGSLFYRSGTDEEKELADKLKTRFCHKKGDVFTTLNVFKEWNGTNEKLKSRWCMENSVNAKAMRAVRENINELGRILTKDLGMTLDRTFQAEGEDLEEALTSVMMQAFFCNISVFLGHKKAGYLTTKSKEPLHIHPSCALEVVGHLPNWVIFNTVLETSRKFMMSTTAIDRGMLESHVASGMVPSGCLDLQSASLCSTTISNIGSEALKKFIGPRYVNVNKFQEDLSKECKGSIVVTEPDKVRGEIEILAPPAFLEAAKERTAAVIRLETQSLANQRSELPLSKDRSCKVVLGEGLAVERILIPGEFCTLLLANVSAGLTVDHIKAKFSKYAPHIISCFQFRNNRAYSNPGTVWGKISFSTPEDAQEALQESFDDLVVRPDGSLANSENLQRLKLNFSWQRRKAKGIAFVTPLNAEDLIGLLHRLPVAGGRSTYHSIVIAGNNANIKLNKDGSGFFIAGLQAGVNENDVKTAFQNHNVLVEKISIPRMPQIPVEEQEVEDHKKLLTSVIKRIINEDNSQVVFDVHVFGLRPQTVDVRGIITFEDHEFGSRVLRELNRTHIGDAILNLDADFECSIRMRPQEYESAKVELLETLRWLERDNPLVKSKIKQLQSQNWVIELHSSDMQALVKVTTELQKVAAGDEINQDKSNYSVFFSDDGKRIIEQVMSETGAYICLDARYNTVKVYGTRLKKTRALEKLAEVVNERSTLQKHSVDLKAPGKPLGLMKAVVAAYGVDLQRLQAATGVVDIKLDMRQHQLRFQASEEAKQRVDAALQTLTEELAEAVHHPQKDDIDCSVCWTSVDNLKQLYRLQVCGHAYCRECVRAMIQTALTDRNLPILCAVEDCGVPVAQRDVDLLEVNKQQLQFAALDAYLTSKPDLYKYCRTPECPLVYRISSDGRPFRCPDCGILVCTTCHADYHMGMTCAMYKSTLADGGDSLLEAWKACDPENRHRCPRCKGMIEKNGGCQHVTCKCGAHICWVCKAVFDTHGQCYGHLSAQHGGFM